MNYIAYSPKESVLTFDYDFRKSSYYDGSKIYSHDGSSSVSKIIKEMKFDLSESSVYSGEFIGDHSSATSHFSSGYSSLGLNFNKDFYIKIKNKTEYSKVGGSFIFSHTKKTRGTEIIFSNYNQSSSNPKGFEFGINDSNKLFFECNSSSGPVVFCLNNIPFKKNIYCVDVNPIVGKVSLCWFDHSFESFEKKTFSVDPNYLRPSSDWYIGTGVYSGESGINYSSTGYPCNSYIDRFMHFDVTIGDVEKNIIAQSIYQNVDFVEETFEEIPKQITGYSSIENIVSGITGYVNVITGYSEQINEQREYITGENLYGTVNSGEYVYNYFSDVYSGDARLFEETTGIYERIEVDEPTYGITGFSTGLYVEDYSYGPVEPLYYYSGVSGEIYKTYDYQPLYGQPSQIKKSDAAYNISGRYPVVMHDGSIGYGPRSYTYLGARNSSKDFIETQKGINLFSINNFSDVSSSNSYINNAYISWPNDLEFNNDALSLVVNGLTKQKGKIQTFQDQDLKTYKRVVDGEFQVDSSRDAELLKQSNILYNDEYLSILVDSPVIDILKTGITEQSLRISDTSEYSSKPFSEINPAGRNVFLNGQKIYENIDYTVVGQDFNPIGDCLNITGEYHTTSDWNYDDDLSIRDNVTGMGSYDIHEVNAFSLDSFVSYLNGIRLDPKAFVYHDTEVDLIAQGKPFIVENIMKEVYNNKVGIVNFVTLEGMEITGKDYAVKGEIPPDGIGVYDEYHNVLKDGSLPSENADENILNLNYEDI